jgi:hypothetical protein
LWNFIQSDGWLMYCLATTLSRRIKASKWSTCRIYSWTYWICRYFLRLS